jgi:putative transcriptional regulator
MARSTAGAEVSLVKYPFRKRGRLTAALLAVTVLLGSAPSVPAPASKLTAILIVARSVVTDPNFAGSVVLVMNDLGPAPVGIIINRPTPLTVARFFPQLRRIAPAHGRMYYGGPVEFGKVWYLLRAKAAPASAVRVCRGVYVSSDRKLLLRLLARKDPLRGLRLFIGHAGWAPGQLQAEIEGGAWAPRGADADSIFDPKPLRPWPAHGGAGGGT